MLRTIYQFELTERGRSIELPDLFKKSANALAAQVEDLADARQQMPRTWCRFVTTALTESGLGADEDTVAAWLRKVHESNGRRQATQPVQMSFQWKAVALRLEPEVSQRLRKVCREQCASVDAFVSRVFQYLATTCAVPALQVLNQGKFDLDHHIALLREEEIAVDGDENRFRHQLEFDLYEINSLDDISLTLCALHRLLPIKMRRAGLSPQQPRGALRMQAARMAAVMWAPRPRREPVGLLALVGTEHKRDVALAHSADFYRTVVLNDQDATKLERKVVRLAQLLQLHS